MNEKIDGKTIHFFDDTSEEFDVLIAATGYLIDLPFVHGDIVPMEDNRLDLYKRMMQPGWLTSTSWVSSTSIPR